MVRSALLLLATLGTTLPCAAPAQQPSAVIATEQAKQLGELHDRAAAIVRDEDARAAHPLCDMANNYTQSVCESKETALTDANETKLVRTLGAFYRLHLRYAGTPPKPGPLSFDQAEASWHLFRDQVCQSVADQYAGGTAQSNIQAACEIGITRHHIDELWAVYKDID